MGVSSAIYIFFLAKAFKGIFKQRKGNAKVGYLSKKDQTRIIYASYFFTIGAIIFVLYALFIS